MIEKNKNFNYLGFIFSIPNYSYIQSEELVNDNYILVLCKSKLSKSIIITSNKISKETLNSIKLFEYSFDLLDISPMSLKFEELSPLSLSLKISNSNSFSIEDMIPYTNPKIYSSIKKETVISDIGFLGDEIKIRIENCFDDLNLRKYLI